MNLRPLMFPVAALFLSLFLAATAVAQTAPTFTYAKPDEVKVAAVPLPRLLHRRRRLLPPSSGRRRSRGGS